MFSISPFTTPAMTAFGDENSSPSSMLLICGDTWRPGSASHRNTAWFGGVKAYLTSDMNRPPHTQNYRCKLNPALPQLALPALTFVGDWG
jgi:hypothetical protein